MLPNTSSAHFPQIVLFIETVLPPLATVVNNQHYRLHYTTKVPTVNGLRVMYSLKNQIDALHPTPGTFYGFTPIRLLPFLATIKDALDALRKSDKINVRVLA